jgi:WD40 repeat protein
VSALSWFRRRQRIVDVRFPVADGDTGRLWTLRLEQVSGRPGLWPHPDNAHVEVAPSFATALQNAWEWAAKQDSRASSASVRWQLIHEGGDPRATGGSAGAAAAVGIAYLLGLTRVRRGVDRRSAVTATVTGDAEGLLGSVDRLPAKLARGGQDFRRLVVSRPDVATANEARQADRPEVVPARDVLEAATLMARPRISLRGALAAFAAVVILAGGTSWYFLGEAAADQSAARLSQAHAQAYQLASLADGLAPRDPAAALRLSVAAYATDKTSPGAQAALIQTTQEDSRITSFLGVDGDPAITRIAGSPSGRLAVSADATGVVRVWRPACKTCQPTVLSHGAAVNALAVAPDGSLVAVARGTGITVTSPTGQAVRGWPAGGLQIIGGAVDTLAINADASQIAVGTSYDEVYVWTRGRAGGQEAAMGNGAVVSAAVFLPDGRLVTGTAAVSRIGRQDLSAWATRSGHLARTVLKQPAPSTLILPGVRALAVVGNDLVIGESFLEVRPLNSLDSVRTLHVTDAVDLLAAVGGDRVLVGTTPSLAITAPPAGGMPPTLATTFTETSLTDGQPVDAPFSASLTCLIPAATVGPDHTVLAGTTSGTLVRWSPAPPSGPEIGRISPDPLDPSGVIATRADGSVVAFDASSGKMTSVVPVTRHGTAYGLAVAGATLFVGYADGTVLRVSRKPAHPAVTLLHLREKVFTLAYSAKGNMLAVGGTSGTIGLYDATNGTLIQMLPHPHQGNVYAIAFSPSGALVASSDVKDQVLVQSVNGSQTRSAAILGVGFLAWQGNDTLLAGSGIGFLYRLSLQSSGVVSRPVAHPEGTNILGGSLDPAGHLLILASANQEADLLDAGTGRVVARFPTLDGTRTGGIDSFAGDAWAAAFTSGGRYAVFGTTQGHLQAVTVDLAVLVARACAMGPLPPAASSGLSSASLLAAETACR